jgi:hypothetical protein
MNVGAQHPRRSSVRASARLRAASRASAPRRGRGGLPAGAPSGSCVIVRVRGSPYLGHVSTELILHLRGSPSRMMNERCVLRDD